MPIATHYRQADFPPILRWQAVAFMRVEWPFIFRGAGRFAEHPYVRVGKGPCWQRYL